MLVLNSAYSNGTVSTPSHSISTLMRSQIVAGVRLDDILHLARLDFIKIDVEGHEFLALRGFEQHIRRFRPVIVSEFAPTGMHDATGYLRFFFDLGYQIAVVQFDGNVVRCGQDEQAVMSHWRSAGVDHIDILALPDEADRA
jgi:hypothetical protein